MSDSLRVDDLVSPMGTMNNEEPREIENLDREEAEEVRVEAEDVSRIAPWTRQITIRGLVASLLIGIMYSVIVMKLNLTTGLVPNLNVSAALLGFVFIRTWTKLLEKAKIVSTPFTRQENTVIQTCAVACYSIAVGGGGFLSFFRFLVSKLNSSFYISNVLNFTGVTIGGFGSYLLGLNRETYEQVGAETEGNTPGSTKEPGIGWMTGFLFVTSFVGLLALVPLRKVLLSSDACVFFFLFKC